MPPLKDLAAALLQEHALRADVLERARQEQERSGRQLWAVLAEAGLCTDDMLFLALRRWGGVTAVAEEKLGGLSLPVELREAIPRELAGELGVLPLERSPDGKRVALAMVDPMVPSASLQPVRLSLARLGVVEIHRFLIHRAVLRRYLPVLYADTAPTRLPEADVPLSDQPTGMVTLPEYDGAFARSQKHAALAPSDGKPGLRTPPPPGGRQGRTRKDEKTQRIPGRGERPHRPLALVSPPVQPFVNRTATQPLTPVVAAGPDRPLSVQIDPQLIAEIAQLGVQAPAGSSAPQPTSVSGSVTQQIAPVLGAATPAMPTASNASLLTTLPGSAPNPAPAAAAHDTATVPMVAVEFSDPSMRPSAGTPERPHFAAAQYLTQVLLLTVESLVRELEGRLLRAGELGAIELSQLARRAARHLGLFQRGAEEIGFLALLYGIERLRLEDEGPLPLPPALATELGWVGQESAGLGPCLKDLQAVLRAIDADQAGQSAASDHRPALFPIGTRIVRCAAAALDVVQQGVGADILAERLHERVPPSEVSAAVLQILLSQIEEQGEKHKPQPARRPAGPRRLPTGEYAAGRDPADRTDPDRDTDLTRELPLPSSSPAAPAPPADLIPSASVRPAPSAISEPSDPEIELTDISDAGLETYQPEET